MPPISIASRSSPVSSSSSESPPSIIPDIIAAAFEQTDTLIGIIGTLIGIIGTLIGIIGTLIGIIGIIPDIIAAAFEQTDIMPRRRDGIVRRGNAIAKEMQNSEGAT